jgi:2-dehydropantoate 2-reductase
MKLGIVGGGGLGSKYAAYLANVAEVVVLHHRREYVDAVRSNGLRLISPTGDRVTEVSATLDPADLAECDVLILTVKSYDTAAAIAAVEPFIGAAPVITLQNGLGNLEIVAQVVGAARAVLGVTMNGATLLRPGVVEDKGLGPTYLAATDVSRETLVDLADLSSQAGLPTEVTDDVTGILWSKLCMAAGINPVAAVLRVPNGVLSTTEAARRVSLTAIREAVEVARAQGLSLPFDPEESFAEVTRATATMYSGTLLDVVRGRPTEVDAISGAVAREGHRLGVATPANELLWQLVKALEETAAWREREPDSPVGIGLAHEAAP